MDVAGADLEQVVEGARDHVALFDFGHVDDGGIEGGEGLFGGVGEADLGEGDVIAAQERWVENGAEALDIALVLEAFEADLCGGFRQADEFGQIGHSDAPVARQDSQDFAVDLV